jgi:hypothetical protein
VASRGLGSLTLDLVLKLGGFTGPLDKAGRELDQKTRAMQKRALEFGKQIGTALKVGLGLGTAALGLYIRNTIEAEKVQAQLTARINDTAGAAGRSLQQLNAQAEKLQSLTVFDDESIGSAQAALLTFTQIQGLNFDRTIEAATDLATVMGTDVADAAKILGKALSDPLAGIGALRKAGITLTDDQKLLVKQLQDTGDIAGAQGVILDALAGKMGTAAEAARNTLGGALQGLQNSFNNLLEGNGSDAGVRDATKAINEFSASLDSPQAKASVSAIINALVTVAGWVGTVASTFVKAAQQIGNTLGLLGQYAEALQKVGKAALSGDFEGVKAAREKFLSDYRNFVEETRRTRGDFDAVVSGTTSGPTVGRRSGPNGPLNRVRVTASNDTETTRANTGATKENTAAKQSAATANNDLAESIERADKATEDFNHQLEDLTAQQGGPLAESQLRYRREEEALTKLWSEGTSPVASELEEAITKLHQARDADAESIRKGLDTGEQQLKQMRDELQILQATSQAERDRIAFKKANPTATDAQANEAVGLGVQIDETKRAISAMDEFRSSFEDNVADVITGSKSIGDAFKSLADSIIQQLARIVAQQLSAKLFGDMGTTGGGSSGGWLGALFSLFGGSGSSGGGFSGSAGAAGSMFAYAGGTDSAAGGLSIVGERGPEIVNLPRGSTVTPNHKLGQSNVFNISIANGTPQVAQQVANEVARKLSFSSRGGR